MERFWKKVDKKEPDECWEWKGGIRGKNGYGAFKYEGKTASAHKVSYLISNGEIPDGMLVCHTCDNRKCVNPKHLFLGSHQDNYDDAIQKGRIVQQSKWNLKDLKHPSLSTYDRGCRCDSCKALKAKKNAKRYTLKNFEEAWLF